MMALAKLKNCQCVAEPYIWSTYVNTLIMLL
uniref:Uncharacterized protein n=1 Tax=Arundo donax TaxID=35708 RepID=A0A0A8XTJ6_ARUDO